MTYFTVSLAETWVTAQTTKLKHTSHRTGCISALKQSSFVYTKKFNK